MFLSRSLTRFAGCGALALLFVTGCSFGFHAAIADEVQERDTDAVWASGAHSLIVNGQRREFLLDVPLDLKAEAALLLCFHGYTGSAKGFRSDAGFTELSNKHGFVVAYPQGTVDSRGNTFFNVGYEFHAESNVSDVDFARKLTTRLVEDLKLDPNAVFSTGMSNGGDMSFFLGSRPNPFVRSIAPVAGTMMLKGHDGFVPQKRLSVMEVHGTKDGITLWKGDLENNDGWGAYYGIEQVIGLWTEGLALERKTSEPRSGIRSDEKQIVRHRWSTATDDTEVIFYEIIGGKHTWPDDLGRTGVSLAEEIWQFFKRHR